MSIVRGTQVKWKEGASYIKGRVKKIYEKATSTINEHLEHDFLIRQENGVVVIKNAKEIEKA